MKMYLRESRRTRHNAFYSRFFIIMLSLLFILAAVEILLRVPYIGKLVTSRNLVNNRQTFNVPINKKDIDLFWRLKPSAAYKKIFINSKGFRGDEFSFEKKDRTFRIFTLGDSCTLGVGLANEKTYSVILGRMLNNKTGSLKLFEVVNAGVAGYSSYQGMIYFKNEIIKYKPDLITLYFGLNDYLYTDGESDNDRARPNKFIFDADNLLSKSRIYKIVKKRLFLLLQNKPVIPPKRRVPLSDFKKNLIEIINLAKQSGIKVVLINLPLRPDVPLAVNSLPVISKKRGQKVVNWINPAIIGKENYYIKTEFEGDPEVLKNTVKDYPEWAMAHYLLAKRYEKDGNYEKADEHYKEAKRRDRDRLMVSKYNNTITDISKARGIPLADIVTVFEKKGKEILFIDERHPNEEGNRLIAEEVFKTLSDHGMIK